MSTKANTAKPDLVSKWSDESDNDSLTKFYQRTVKVTKEHTKDKEEKR